MEDALQDRESGLQSGAAARASGKAVTTDDRINPELPELAAQTVLAEVVRTPERQLMPLIQEIYPDRELLYYAQVIRTVREIVEKLIGGLQKPIDAEPSPTLLDRLSFSWSLSCRSVKWRTQLCVNLIVI
jgi:hypothetical protein